jgi:hypothetical protein
MYQETTNSGYKKGSNFLKNGNIQDNTIYLICEILFL